MISCLTITRPTRLSFAALAIGDFVRQTHVDSELVLVHDGGVEFDSALQRVAAGYPSHRIRVHDAAPGMSLGALRNFAVQLADGDYVCQWDDDDRYHPLRLELQYAALADQRADFCFLSDQLHWFPRRGELFWDDWKADPYPLNFVQGTLLGVKAAIPPYPENARGEDTGLALGILRASRPIVRLRDQGWAYVYVYHGDNVWSSEHHAAISQCKRYSGARLLARENLLRERLAEYTPPLGAVRMPWRGGSLSFG